VEAFRTSCFRIVSMIASRPLGLHRALISGESALLSDPFAAIAIQLMTKPLSFSP
jgi:hypothetical protein